jgi:hypothetical protein
MLGELLHRVGGGRISYNPLDALAGDTVEEEREEEGEEGEEGEEARDAREEEEDEEDDDSDDEEELNVGSSSSNRTMSSAELLLKMEKHLGKPVLDRLLSKIYMLRADPNFYVKQTAQNTWKGMITNTGKVLRTMLVQFMVGWCCGGWCCGGVCCGAVWCVVCGVWCVVWWCVVCGGRGIVPWAISFCMSTFSLFL